MAQRTRAEQIALDPRVNDKARALFTALDDRGFNDTEIGALLLGMAIGALIEGGADCAAIHEMVDAVFKARADAS